MKLRKKKTKRYIVIFLISVVFFYISYRMITYIMTSSVKPIISGQVIDSATGNGIPGIEITTKNSIGAVVDTFSSGTNGAYLTLHDSCTNCTLHVNDTKFAAYKKNFTVPPDLSMDIPLCPYVRVAGKTVYHATLMSAYNAADNNDIIQILAKTIPEAEGPIVYTGPILFDSNKTLTLQGGFNCTYINIIGNSEFKGTGEIINGMIVAENIEIKRE